MGEFMNITKALADENCVRALLALRKGELRVCQITELFWLAPSTMRVNDLKTPSPLGKVFPRVKAWRHGRARTQRRSRTRRSRVPGERPLNKARETQSAAWSRRRRGA